MFYDVSLVFKFHLDIEKVIYSIYSTLNDVISIVFFLIKYNIPRSHAKPKKMIENFVIAASWTYHGLSYVAFKSVLYN